MIKLDIGCGGRGSVYEGYTGIDTHPRPEKLRKKGTKYVQMDFVHGELRWSEYSVDHAIALHVIEHMERSEGRELIRRAMYLLKPECELVISVPDLRLFAEKYLERDKDFWNKKYKSGKDMWPGKTLADRFNYQIHRAGHIWAYDSESLAFLAREAGVKNMKELPKDHYFCGRPDHEIGLICRKSIT